MRSRSHPRTRTMSAAGNRPRPASPWWLVLIVVIGAITTGCSDPGSGGSGVPGASASPAPIDAPATGASTLTGTIEALDATTLTVRGSRIDYTRATIVRSDGSAASAADLQLGQAVTVTLAEGGVVAIRIVIL